MAPVLELSQKSGHQIYPGHLNDLDHQTAAASAASRALALATPTTDVASSTPKFTETHRVRELEEHMQTNQLTINKRRKKLKFSVERWETKSREIHQIQMMPRPPVSKTPNTRGVSRLNIGVKWQLFLPVAIIYPRIKVIKVLKFHSEPPRKVDHSLVSGRGTSCFLGFIHQKTPNQHFR